MGTLEAHDIQAMSHQHTTTQAITTGEWITPATRQIRSEMASTCQTLQRLSSAQQTMAFKNEVVSDEDIDRYNLPFPKGGGRWWTRDAERDYYLWGGLSGNPAFDDMQEGRFFLYVEGKTYWVKLIAGKGSESLKESPYIIKWDSVARIEPALSEADKYSQITRILKEALIAYGYEGEDDGWVKNPKVIIGF